MANEITWDTVTGLTLNVYRFKTNDNVFLANPATDEVWGTDGRDASDYAVPMSESGTSGHYSVDFNDGGAIAAGVYRIVIALQAGVNPANDDRKIARGEIDWDGTAEITPSVIDTVVDTIAGDVVNIDGAAMRGTDGANTTVPDVAGTAAGLHATTDGKIDAVQGDVTTIAGDVANIDGEAMRGTDGAITSLDAITTDKDSYKATGFATPTNITDAHTITDGKIDVTDGLIGGLNDISPAEVNTEVDSALSDYGANTVVPDAAGTAAGLHGITDGKIDALNNITVADILAGVIEGTITLQQSLRGLMSTNFGKASGGDTTSIKFRNLADTKNRITETVDSNGNRTSVTLDLT